MRRALLALVLIAAEARAETRPHYGGTVEAALLGAPTALDPIAAQTHAELTVVGLVFDTLYALGPDGSAQPHLAIGAPAFDPARMIVHVALRRGVAFHDGTPLTAGDVADSLERVRKQVPWLLAPVSGIRTSGDGIDLVLLAPVADIAALLALPATAITKRGQSPSGMKPIGSGPFAVERLDPQARRLTLRAFDEHFAGRPYLDRLVLGWFDAPDAEARRFETGAAQLSARGEGAFAGARPKYAAAEVESPASVLVFVGFGTQHAAITGSREFRRALDLALDRGALAMVTTGERTQPTRVPLPVEAGGPVLDAAGRAGDAQAARNVLAAAKLPGLAQLKLTIVIDATRPDDRELALRVSRGLDKLGIGFEIAALPPEELRARAGGNTCDLWIGQLAAPIGLPAAWWGPAFASERDQWAVKRLAAGSVDARAAIAELARRMPILPLMFRALRVWHRVDVRGLWFDAIGRPGLADLYWLKGRP